MLLLTFGLTVFVDLTVAIAVGVTVASLLFMARMSETVRIDSGQSGAGDGDLPDDAASQRDDLPKGVEVFRITGPFFFGVAGELLDALRRVGQSPKIIILRMRLVPMLDASGVSGVESFVRQAGQSGAAVIISGAQPQAKAMLARGGLDERHLGLYFTEDYDSAIQKARGLLDEART